MSSKFNVRLSFKGDGDLTFQLPIVGEITIWAGRDIFLKGATAEIVETLRQYRSMKLEHKLNADAKGCYRVIEVDNIERIPYGLYRSVAVPKAENISDLKKTLIRNNDFIPVEEAGTTSVKDLETKQEEQKEKELEKINTKPDKNDVDTNLQKTDENIEEPKNTEKTLSEELTNYIIKTTKNKGKKLGDLDERELRKLARYSSNAEEKEKAKEALDILYPSAE
jgi:hypothetical protein